MSRRKVAGFAFLVGVLWAAISLVPSVKATDLSSVTAARGPRGHRRDVVVVLLDPAFMEAADNAPLDVYAKLILGPTTAKPSTLIIEPEVLDRGRAQIRPSDLALANAEDMSSLLAPLLHDIGSTVVAFTGDTTGSSSASPPTVGIPRVDATLAEAVTGTALAAQPVSDDVMRRETIRLAATPVSTRGRVLIPSAALLAVARNDGATRSIRVDEDEIVVGHRRIPTEAGLGLRTNYLPALLPGGAQVMTGSELLKHPERFARMKGKIVVMGISESAGGPMLPATITGHDQPRAVVTANAIATMISGRFLRPASTWDRLLVALAAASIGFLLWAFLPEWLAALISVGLVGGWWWYVQDQVGHGRILGAIGPIGVIIAMGLTVGVVRLVGALRHRRKVSALFSRYVPASVASQLMEGGLADELAAGSQHDVTVLFIDLRGFTPLSRQLEPAQIRRILDHFYEYVCERVLDGGGTVMQFVGDEVFAVFGAPLARDDHARAALTVAIGLQDDVAALDTALRSDDLPSVRFGIGVNSGDAVAAHVGTATRSQYTVLGDTVNTGSRLCGIADANQVIASSTTTQAAPDHHLQAIGTVNLKGIDQPVTIFQHGPGEPRGTINPPTPEPALQP